MTSEVKGVDADAKLMDDVRETLAEGLDIRATGIMIRVPTLRFIMEMVDALTSQIAEFTAAAHAIEVAVVHEAGGTVEGQPTSTINYLQRVRELREIESRLAAAERDRGAAERLRSISEALLVVAEKVSAQLAADRDAAVEQASRSDHLLSCIESYCAGAIKRSDELPYSALDFERIQELANGTSTMLAPYPPAPTNAATEGEAKS
jgi:hypothetical protein